MATKNLDTEKELEYVTRWNEVLPKIRRGSDSLIAKELGISVDTVRNAKQKRITRWDILEAYERKFNQ